MALSRNTCVVGIKPGSLGAWRMGYPRLEAQLHICVMRMARNSKQKTRRDAVNDLFGDLCLRPYKQMIPILDKAVRGTSFKKTRGCNGTACRKCICALVFQL